MKTRILKQLHFLMVSILIFNISSAQPISEIKYKPIREYTGQTVFDLEKTPEENIDIGLWSLIIAKENDSTIDISHYLKQLDDMVAEINRMIAGREGDMVKFMMTKMYIYDTGQWNNYENYSYDLDDPFGKDTRKQLLPYYIDIKAGNCVSMPTLFLSLMERVDSELQFFGVSAPLHLFCRMYDRQTSDLWNVEATNGGNPTRDIWYMEQFNITQKAADSGLYLRTLSKKEYVAELIGSLVSKYRIKGQYNKAIKYNEIILKINPNSAVALVQQGALLAWQGNSLQDNIIAQNRRPTNSEFQKLNLYQVESEKYINLAMMKGWNPETPKERDKYMEILNREKDK